jgi:hypothetical protein
MFDLQDAPRIAASYPPEARHVPVWERHRYFSDAQHLAWMLRFDPEAAADVLSANRWPSFADIWPLEAGASCSPHQESHRG